MNIPQKSQASAALDKARRSLAATGAALSAELDAAEQRLTQTGCLFAAELAKAERGLSHVSAALTKSLEPARTAEKSGRPAPPRLAPPASPGITTQRRGIRPRARSCTRAGHSASKRLSTPTTPTFRGSGNCEQC